MLVPVLKVDVQDTNMNIQWDTYRTLYPLMSLHDPETYARVVRSFIDIQQHEGWLPECRGATLQMSIQGGTSGDPILAEFYIKCVSKNVCFNFVETNET